jgi:hypothetical protein
MDRESAVDISRRTALKQLSFLVCAVPVSLATMATSAEAQRKATKAQSNYKDEPVGNQKCSNCVYFVPARACKIVEGDISPEAWCRFWKGK